MKNLEMLNEIEVNQILQANGYSTDDILTSDFFKTNDRKQAVYKILYHDEQTDELGSSFVYFHYMTNGTIYADF